ncbi:MAG: putative thioredoxin [Halieaceae bacterium]|jgi:putative thioredoxin
MSEYIVEINEQNASQYLIEESHQRLVVADFWADWCEPCKVLMPLLEKLANEYAGQFLLAKVNADEMQNIAQQLGVRSLPTVIMLKDGQPVDGFVGAQPENQIREILDKYLPKPWDADLDQALQLMAESAFAEALPILRSAHEQSGGRHDIAMAFTQVLIELKRFAEAQELIDAVKIVDRDNQYEQVKGLLDIRQEAAKTPEMKELETKLSADPDNLDLRYQLAVQYGTAGSHSEAMELLIGIMQVDKHHGDGAVRKALLDIIASLGKGDPMAVEFQRKLFGLMY